MKTAIAFSYGEESATLLLNFLREKPALVIEINEGVDVSSITHKLFCKILGVPGFVVKNNETGHRVRFTIESEKKEIIDVDSNVIDAVAKRGYKRLLYGYTKLDFHKRTGVLISKQPVIQKKGLVVEFPLWNTKRKKEGLA